MPVAEFLPLLLSFCPSTENGAKPEIPLASNR
jgi:hypothetical protein